MINEKYSKLFLMELVPFSREQQASSEVSENKDLEWIVSLFESFFVRITLFSELEKYFQNDRVKRPGGIITGRKYEYDNAKAYICSVKMRFNESRPFSNSAAEAAIIKADMFDYINDKITEISSKVMSEINSDKKHGYMVADSKLLYNADSSIRTVLTVSLKLTNKDYSRVCGVTVAVDLLNSLGKLANTKDWQGDIRGFEIRIRGLFYGKV